MATKTPMTERILVATDKLFYQHGIRAVGVDKIAAEAGISKRSLYDTFASKDELVTAYLKRRITLVPESDEPPLRRILALFDQLHARFVSGTFRGCPFVNAVTELAGDIPAADSIARDVKDKRRQLIETWLGDAGARDARTLGIYIALLIEGAYVTMLLHNDPTIALQAKDAAILLMRAAGLHLPVTEDVAA